MARDFIQSLGGAAALASDLGLPRSTVTNWLKRGVPWRFRLRVARIAEKRGVTVPRGFLEHDAEAA